MEAAKKKHEAIETDTAAYKERVQAIDAVAKELEREGYHDIKRIRGRKDNILRLWEQLQELLRNRRQRLEMNLTLQHLFQEMLHSINWMDEVKVSCRWMQEIQSQHEYGALVPPHRGSVGLLGESEVVMGCLGSGERCGAWSVQLPAPHYARKCWVQEMHPWLGECITEIMLVLECSPPARSLQLTSRYITGAAGLV